MRLILLSLSGLLVAAISYSQQVPINFSDAIKPHLNKYNLQSDIEFERGNLEKGLFLFDSLVQNYLVGSRFTDYALKNVHGGKVRLGKIKKPIFLITYASWCVLSRGQISALNKLSRKYSGDVQFVVLFWDRRSNVRKIARKFSGQIKVCYANERYRNDSNIVSTLKHTLGFPTSYYLNSALEVIDIKRGGVTALGNSTYLTDFNLNYKVFNDRLTEFLIKKNQVKTQLATAE